MFPWSLKQTEHVSKTCMSWLLVNIRNFLSSKSRNLLTDALNQRLQKLKWGCSCPVPFPAKNDFYKPHLRTVLEFGPFGQLRAIVEKYPKQAMVRNILIIHSGCPAGNSSILRILKRRRRLAVTQSSLACFCPAPTWSKLPQSSSKKSFWLLLCMSNTFCMVIKDIWTRKLLKLSPRLLFFFS